MIFSSLACLKADRDVMSRLGLLAHLEAMRGDGLGIQNIETHDCAAASSTALRVWEDSNFPYRCDLPRYCTPDIPRVNYVLKGELCDAWSRLRTTAAVPFLTYR